MQVITRKFVQQALKYTPKTRAVIRGSTEYLFMKINSLIQIPATENTNNFQFISVNFRGTWEAAASDCLNVDGSLCTMPMFSFFVYFS